MLLERISGLQGCRILVLRNVKVARHCNVVLEDILKRRIILDCLGYLRLKRRAVGIKLVAFLIYNIGPDSFIKSASPRVLIFQVFKSRDLPLDLS